MDDAIDIVDRLIASYHRQGDELAAERRLSDQLADALRDEARNHELRGGASDALDAYREARRER